MVREHVAAGNEIRGLLEDMRVVIPTGGEAAFKNLLPALLEDAEQPISYRGQLLLDYLRSQWLEKEAHVKRYIRMFKEY
mgnify:CR=1 FL=1